MGSINTPTPDPEYSFQVVVFEVGNKTFRVPRHGFEGSSFPLPLSRDENTPHRLEVDEGPFRALLRAMFPFAGCQSLTTNDWLDALDLATKWNLVEVRNRAINALDNWIENHPAKKVVLLAKQYSIPSWLNAGYLRLIQQNVLTTQDLLSPPSLDWETIGRLLEANITASVNTVDQDIQGCCSLCDRHACDCQEVVLQSIIVYEFKEEFKCIERVWPLTTNNPSLDETETPPHDWVLSE